MSDLRLNANSISAGTYSAPQVPYSMCILWVTSIVQFRVYWQPGSGVELHVTESNK